MARINSYPKDTTPEGSDIILGNGAGDGGTKTFKLDNIAGWLSESGGVSVVGQHSFKHYGNINPSPDGALWLSGAALDASFNSINEILLSKTDVRARDIEAYLTTLEGKSILLQEVGAPGSFGAYTVSNVAQSPDYANFLVLRLSFIEGNGTFTPDAYYGLGLQAGASGLGDGAVQTFDMFSEDGSLFTIAVTNAGVLIVIPEGSTDPVITSPPVITGTEKVWYTLGAIAGGVTGSPTPERTWQWQRSTNGLTWTDIPGADAATYTLVVADANKYIRVQQTETNVLDSVTANSAATGLIADSVFSTTTYANITPITWENITQTWN